MLRIATCQMTSGPDIGANVQIAESLIRKAAREGANLALLPEMFTIMSNDPKDVLRLAEQYQDGPVQRIMSGLAKSLGIWIADHGAPGIDGAGVPPESTAAGRASGLCGGNYVA